MHSVVVQSSCNVTTMTTMKTRTAWCVRPARVHNEGHYFRQKKPSLRLHNLALPKADARDPPAPHHEARSNHASIDKALVGPSIPGLAVPSKGTLVTFTSRRWLAKTLGALKFRQDALAVWPCLAPSHFHLAPIQSCAYVSILFFLFLRNNSSSPSLSLPPFRRDQGGRRGKGLPECFAPERQHRRPRPRSIPITARRAEPSVSSSQVLTQLWTDLP